MMVDAMCFESSQESVDDAGDGVDADTWAHRNFFFHRHPYHTNIVRMTYLHCASDAL
jgi:hypothetical protein